MSGTTPRLNLYMKDPVVDQEDTFNIETMLNGNWRKIDEKVATKEELAAAGKVQSVNGKTGAVTLTAADVGAETPVGALQQINAAIAALINGAPGALDTLEELANAMGNDPNFATTVINRIAAAEQKNTETEQKVTSHSAETASKFTNINLNIIDMAVELETLKGATLNGVTANIFVETFTNLNDINLMNGIYDSTNKRLVL